MPDNLVGHFLTERGNPRTEWKRSLGTKDREEAKRLLRPHVAETDSLIDKARLAKAGTTVGVRPKSPAQIERERARWEWEQEQSALLSQALEDADSEIEALEPMMDALADGEAVPDGFSSAEVARAARLQLLHEREHRESIAFSKQVQAVKSHAGKPSASDALKLAKLFERYASTGTANPKTISRWRGRVADLIVHLGHDDASKVTKADLNAWTAALVAKGLAKKTVTAGYIPAIRAALNVAYDDELIPANPACGLKVRAPKAVQLRERDLTDIEAQTILAATLKVQPEKLAVENALARRWVPWLCAYTGARVGEMTQLRACDIQQEGEVWLIHITPEAGSVKTSKARKVPLHPHLIEQGFPVLAKAGDTTPLFYRDGAGNEINPAYKVRAADLAKWVRRLGITAPQPNHGWRHRFKTLAREYGIPADMADAIQGHAPRNEGGKYGVIPLIRLRDEIAKLPHYLIPEVASHGV